jgi:hypothetical protein
MRSGPVEASQRPLAVERKAKEAFPSSWIAHSAEGPGVEPATTPVPSIELTSRRSRP